MKRLLSPLATGITFSQAAMQQFRKNHCSLIPMQPIREESRTMPRKKLHNLALVCLAIAVFFWVPVAISQATTQTPYPAAKMPSVLYGAAYYNEYMPYERLDTDVDLMKKAGITVVRMGESTWSLWEPEDGKFEYAWMDRIVAAMGKAGIKVIMGTPTYSIPTWMYRKHPEILARPLGGAPVFYGMRQNMDYDNPDFRRYAARLIKNLVEHYRDNPTVIGWQVDNETGSNNASNPDVFEGFRNHLIKKFGTTDALNRAWLLNYWGEDVNGWENLPTRDSATSTAYKLEWARWQQMRVTAYLAWQAGLVRQSRGSGQFVTTDFAGSMYDDRNEFEIAKSLDIVSINSYHGTQDRMDGWIDSENGDFARSLKHSNYLITETNAQTTDWDSAFQFPPYDGQLRMNVYTHLASGADMVEYWHWASIPSGQETYWKGVLSHDLQPNRAYAEVTRTARELKAIGPHVVNLRIKNDVAILYSVDSSVGINAMPFSHNGPQWTSGGAPQNYGTVLKQLHRTLYNLNVGTDFLFPEDPDFSRYTLVVVPPLYVADNALLNKLSEYVKDGGHVLMMFKSGFTNENTAVRWELAPGPLRQAAGFSYQEFSNLEKPLRLKGDPFGAGNGNHVSDWAEFLILDHATALAYYDHPFFGQWPAITRNLFGHGDLTYEGTLLSDELQKNVVLNELKLCGLTSADQDLPDPVRVKHGINKYKRKIHYLFNYSSAAQTFSYRYGRAQDLLTGKTLGVGQAMTLSPWGVVIAEEVR